MDSDIVSLFLNEFFSLTPCSESIIGPINEEHMNVPVQTSWSGFIHYNILNDCKK